jgi:hypothetical protein
MSATDKVWLPLYFKVYCVLAHRLMWNSSSYGADDTKDSTTFTTMCGGEEGGGGSGGGGEGATA